MSSFLGTKTLQSWKTEPFIADVDAAHHKSNKNNNYDNTTNIFNVE
jgi:hypothetical protein